MSINLNLKAAATSLLGSLFRTQLIADMTAIETTVNANEVQLNALQATAGVSEWSSGGTYAAGEVAYSPTNFLNYRNKTGAVGTDPAGDATNWESMAQTAVEIHSATSKTTPVDADEFGIWDSVTELLNKVTFANLKATVKAALEATGMTFTGPVLFNTIADIASAATIDLTSYGSGFIATVTGTTATSALLMEDGQFGTLVPAAAWPLTYSATACRVSTLADFVCKANQPVRVYKKGGVIFVAPEAHIAESVSASSGVSTTADFAVYTGDIQVKINGTPYNRCWSSRIIGGNVGNMQSTHSVEVTGTSCEIAALLYDTTTALAATLTFPEYGTYMVTATASCSTYATTYANWVSGHAIRVR